MKVVREHYLRDDIYVGCELATEEYRGPDQSTWKLSRGERSSSSTPTWRCISLIC